MKDRAAPPPLAPSLPLYLGVGLVAGAVIALQICIMRIFSVGLLGAFRLARGQPRHAGLRPRQRRHVHRQGLLRPALARRRRHRAGALRAAARRREPRSPSRCRSTPSSCCRTRCRSGVSPPTSPSISCRSWPARCSSAPSSSRRTGSSPASISPTSWGRDSAASLFLGDAVPAAAREPRRHADGAGAGRRASAGSRRLAPAVPGVADAALLAVGGLAVARPFRPAARARHHHAGGVRLQGHVLCPQVPGQPSRLPRLLALRRHRGLRLVLPAFRAGPQRQRRLQPAPGARERLSRALYRRRGAERHHPRPEARGDGLFPLPADGLPLPRRAEPRHVRDPVRRRHLDRCRAARRLEERHGGGIQPRHPQGLPHRPDAARLHRRRAERSARPRRGLRRAPLPRGPPRLLRRRRPQPRRFGRPVGARAASPSWRNTPTRGRRWKPTCGR